MVKGIKWTLERISMYPTTSFLQYYFPFIQKLFKSNNFVGILQKFQTLDLLSTLFYVFWNRKWKKKKEKKKSKFHFYWFLWKAWGYYWGTHEIIILLISTIFKRFFVFPFKESFKWKMDLGRRVLRNLWIFCLLIHVFKLVFIFCIIS